MLTPKPYADAASQESRRDVLGLVVCLCAPCSRTSGRQESDSPHFAESISAQKTCVSKRSSDAISRSSVSYVLHNEAGGSFGRFKITRVQRKRPLEGVSDLAVVLLLLAIRSDTIVTEVFPEYQADVGFLEVGGSRSQAGAAGGVRLERTRGIMA